MGPQSGYHGGRSRRSVGDDWGYDLDSGMSNEVSDNLRKGNPGYATHDMINDGMLEWAIPTHIGTIGRGHIAHPELGGPGDWNGLFLLTLAPSAGDTLLILNLEGPGTGYLAPIQTSMRATCMPLNSHPEASTTMRERLDGKISLANMMLSSRLQLTNTSHSTTSRLQEILLVYLVHDSCSVDSFWISLWMTR